MLGIFISIIVGWILAALIANGYRSIAYNQSKLEKLAIDRNEDKLSVLNYFIDIDSKDEEKIKEGFDIFSNNQDGLERDNIYLVDNNGIIKKYNGKFPIKQIDLTIGEGKHVSYTNIKYTATNIFRVNENTLLVYMYENYLYNDLMMMIIWFLLSGIIFIILVASRVRYIEKIGEAVKEIAKGNLYNRVDIKYKNELTTLGEDINYMARELEFEDMNQRQFITNISHDLRTPLTTILGYSKMIENKVYSTEEELEKYISVINKKGNLLKTMLDDFFDYAKLSSKDIETENTLINLNEMIKQLLDEEEINFKNKNLIINRTIENKKIFIHGDPILIARAFNNLIGNAIKYSKENTIINISVKEESKEGVDYGIVYIENTPRNMLTEENINNFFKRLYKADKSRKEEGSGLGLAITKEIVKAHRGFIDVNLVNGEVLFKIGLIAEV